MEVAERLQPKTDTLRRLYSVSGNQCAFPTCVRPLFNHEGNFVGQICHIEAAMPGGERFNENSTNEQRRTFENLMLMCYDHHIETNKEEDYSVDELKKYKKEHERRFENVEGLINNILESIVDVTASEKATNIENLQKLNGDDSDVSFDNSDLEAFNAMLRTFESLSPEARRIFAISLSRSRYEKNFMGHDSEKIYFDPREIERVTRRADLKSILNELQTNELIDLDEIHVGNEQIEWNYTIYFKGSEVNFWDSIRLHCIDHDLDLVDIVTFMKFTVFDQ